MARQNPNKPLPLWCGRAGKKRDYTDISNPIQSYTRYSLNVEAGTYPLRLIYRKYLSWSCEGRRKGPERRYSIRTLHYIICQRSSHMGLESEDCCPYSLLPTSIRATRVFGICNPTDWTVRPFLPPVAFSIGTFCPNQQPVPLPRYPRLEGDSANFGGSTGKRLYTIT